MKPSLTLRSPIAALLLLASCGPEPAREPAAQTQTENQAPAAGQARVAEQERDCVKRLSSAAEPELHALLRSLCAVVHEQRVPGLAFAWVRPGQPSVHLELGVRCFGALDPVGPDTLFRIGSVSKPITAALALELIEAGKLARASTAAQVPGFVAPKGLAPPRLDELLSHRSGLGEIDPATLVELDGAWLPALARSHPAGAPGSYRYSNAGYALIGALLEVASGQAYPQLVEERIGQRLGLSDLHADTSRPNTACGHLVDAEQWRAISVRDDLAFMPGDPSWMIAAGGVLSSATALARFAMAIGSDELPGSAAMLELGEPLPPALAHPGHPDERYGLGLRSWQLGEDTRMFGHTGNNGAFVAELRLIPGVGAIAILANSGVELAAPVAAAEALLAAS